MLSSAERVFHRVLLQQICFIYSDVMKLMKILIIIFMLLIFVRVVVVLGLYKRGKITQKRFAFKLTICDTQKQWRKLWNGTSL